MVEMTEEKYCLPDDYRSRIENVAYLDVPSDVTYQPLVYEFALFAAARAQAKKIIDIGCGSASKLAPIQDSYEIVCIDTQEGIKLAQSTLKQAKFIEANLESGLQALPEELFDDAVVICADVIEHISNPMPLAQSLAAIEKRCKFLFLSTPDRERARGLSHLGPPQNAAHVREWTAGEFTRFLKDAGFGEGILIGYTVNNDQNLLKATILALAGREARPRRPATKKTVAAIIHTFNEADIIEETVNHLTRQGVEAHIFDNWSTDQTYQIGKTLVARGDCASITRFPETATDQYEWARQLTETTRFAATLSADWVMHHDADELRYSPWSEIQLCDAISFVDGLGYNAIDFSVIDFRFLSDRPVITSKYEASLTHFEFARRRGSFTQIKCWKNSGAPVELALSGGHQAQFEARRIFPMKFLLKHYPLRNPDQALHKVFFDRASRCDAERNDRGWHTHYDHMIAEGVIPEWTAYALTPWQQHFFETEFLVERLAGIGLPVEKKIDPENSFALK